MQQKPEEPVMASHLRNKIRCVNNKINHIPSAGGHKLYHRMRGTQRGRAPGAEEVSQVIRKLHKSDEHQTGCSPFIHNERMPRFGLRLWGCRDKAGLDEQLLARPGFGRNLEVYNLSSFIHI